jgi:pimeloyl-ACP methyl ester carboxylesterase
MSRQPDVLWLNTNPSLTRFHRLLIRYLAKQVVISEWEYQQSPDEPSSLDIALVLLQDYLKGLDRPIHLVGHGTGGLLGLLYGRKYPHRVKSLTLLGVGCHPAVDWQAHYYVLRQHLPCSQERILAQMARGLFGYQSPGIMKGLINILEQDLLSSPSPHSLYQRVSIEPGGVEMPLLVCGSEDDIIVDPNALKGWQPWLKPSDRIWLSPQGHHFFHYFHSQTVGRQLMKFWQKQPQVKELSGMSAMETCS